MQEQQCNSATEEVGGKILKTTELKFNPATKERYSREALELSYFFLHFQGWSVFVESEKHTRVL
jgi:hypothetical protein